MILRLLRLLAAVPVKKAEINPEIRFVYFAFFAVWNLSRIAGSVQSEFIFSQILILIDYMSFHASMRTVRAWEMRGRLYRVLGVSAFGELLRRTPLRYLQPLVYLKRYPGDPARVQIQIEGAEAAHFWAAALVIPYMVFACVQNRWGVVFWFMVVQIVGNVYPIFHLRWVRGRLTRVIDKKRRNHAARNA